MANQDLTRYLLRGRRQPVRRKARWPKILLWIGALALALLGGSLAIITFWPGFAAQNIDHLRDIIGDAYVAQLENLVLGLQDQVQQLEYQTGLMKPAAPWADTQSGVAIPQPGVAIPQPPQGLFGLTLAGPPAISTSAPGVGSAKPQADGSPAWQLAPLPPLGNLRGEGQWSPYIQSGSRIVAYRTFLQPDPRRPYSVVAVVAFDLQATRLHFVLGSIEPRSPLRQPSRTGMIPAPDLQPGLLLATFNGGFKARHGHFGAMADGITALPPIDGLATVAMYADGSVRMGVWGMEIADSPDLVAWRQNSKLLVRDGQINPATTNMNETWGVTIDLKAITWRSALGLSADGRTLYYAAGPLVDVKTIAKVIAHAGADKAMELDVNDYWVNFAAIRSDGTNLSAEPLLPGMEKDVDRYLKASTRDFFYVTAANP